MRIFSKTILFLSFSSFLVACNDSDQSADKPSVAPVPFNPVEATISDVHQSILTQGASCVDIVKSYLDRIEAYDKTGPTLNSIISVNPNALKDAQNLDEEFKRTGQLKGQLHCVTVLPKDNIDTIDMPTTAGSFALEGNMAENDAFIIQKIRAQGGIIIGKANLDEFAFGFGGKSSHPNGGQAKNVYDLTLGPGGSSAGTGTAISASLALVGIGTDTGGSIRVPASVQGLVGLRPSLRLISQDGIIPLAPTQDTAGPMCRKAIDCAVLMDSLVGFDSAYSSNQRINFDRTSALIGSESNYRSIVQQPTTYVPNDTNSLVGKRIGLVKALYAQPNNQGVLSEDSRLVNESIDAAIVKLREAGAIVEEVEIENLSTILTRYSSLSSYEFKTSLTDYLINSKSTFKSYQDLLESNLMIPSFTNYNRDTTSQSHVDGYALNTTERSPYVRTRMSAALDNTQLDRTVKGVRYDVLAYPSITGLAGRLGSGPSTGTNNRLSPFSGYPALSMPAASVNSTRSQYPMNVNIEFIAREFDEPTLFNIAVAFEQINPARQIPVHTPAL